MRIGSSSAALAALLVAGVMTGVSVADTGTGLGLRTADADNVPAAGTGLSVRTVGTGTTAGAGAGSSPARFVTLITGDRVQLPSR